LKNTVGFHFERVAAKFVLE